MEAKTLEGSMVNVAVVEGGVQINGAKVVAADVDASNGVIHGIDTVLVPAS
ncbi:MAG: fasciclin domain-containing protein [Halioglobus sp.]